MFLTILLITTMLQPKLCNNADPLSPPAVRDSFTLIQTGDPLPVSILSAKEKTCQEISRAAQNTLLLIFFADWCPDCELAIPIVETRLQPIMERIPNGEIIALGRENNQTEIDSYIKEKGLTFKVLPDIDRKIYNCFANKYIPRFYLFFNSKVVFECVDFNKKDLRTIRKLLKQRKNVAK